MRFILVRHPETVALQQNLIYGRTHSDLSEHGISTMEWVADMLEKENPLAIYSSPQKRALVLAEAIASRHPGLEIATDERIMEMACGIYEQMTFEEALESDPEGARAFLERFGEYRPEGGENFEDVKRRSAPFIKDIIARGLEEDCEDRPIIVVSHAMTIRSMLSNIFGIELAKMWNLRISPSCIINISYDPEFEFAMLSGLCHPENQKDRNLRSFLRNRRK